MVQVQQSRLVEGEERRLRATLRQLESRRSTVERAGLLHLAVMGEGGVGGIMHGLRALESHANAILDQEEAHASLSLGGKSTPPAFDVLCCWQVLFFESGGWWCLGCGAWGLQGVGVG